MIRYEDNDIILTGETSIDFINRVLHPSIEQSLLSENYQAMINGMTITHLPNGFSVEIPDLLIPEEFSFSNVDVSYIAKTSQSRQFKFALGAIEKNKEVSSVFPVESKNNFYRRSDSYTDSNHESDRLIAA